jgi:hypothetical protein
MTNYVITLAKTDFNQAGPLQTTVHSTQNDAYSARTLAESQYTGYKVVQVTVEN